MPRRRAKVPYASGQFNRAVKFLNTRGQAYLGVALCGRCQSKAMFSELVEDGMIPGFYVHRPELSPGCWDMRNPMDLPAPPPDDLRLPFVRPDVNIAMNGAPIEPPLIIGGVRITEDEIYRITEDGIYYRVTEET